MVYEENTSVRVSQLRPPTTRIPAASGLIELTNSDTNARALASQTTSHKHKLSNVEQPPAKRQTLVARTVQNYRSLPAPIPTTLPKTRPINNIISANVAASTRPVAIGTIASRANGFSNRNVSTSSTTSSASNTRAQSSFSDHRLARNGMTRRPATAMTRYDDDEQGEEGSFQSNKNGMKDFSMSALNSQERDYFMSPNVIDKCRRSFSLSSAFRGLNLQESKQVLASDYKSRSLAGPMSKTPKIPSGIPKRIMKPARVEKPEMSFQKRTSRNLQRALRASPIKLSFLTRDSNTTIATGWDTNGRLDHMENLYSTLMEKVETITTEKDGLDERLKLYQTRVVELEQIRVQLAASNKTLSDELSEVKIRVATNSLELEDSRRRHVIDVDELTRKNRNYIEDLRETHRKELDRVYREERDKMDEIRREMKEELETSNKQRKEEMYETERELKLALEEERNKRLREVQEILTTLAVEKQSSESDMTRRDRELQDLQQSLVETKAELEGSQTRAKTFKERLEDSALNTLTLETSMKALKARIDFLESDNQAQSQAFADLHQKMQDAVDKASEAQSKLRAEETLRRKLHNQVQELKGNIRVFCRVRPSLDSEEDERAKITFPDSDGDSKEVAIQGPEQKSSLGNVNTLLNSFSFDRVFSPSSMNAEIFEEISQLVQSALDGYNVCIFCYGQTGSGKTYTMSSPDGMIPRAVTQIYETAKGLEEKGWTYKMEGSFIEVYNETLNDLLGKAEEWEKKKHEIKHDPAKLRTTVTDVNVVPLDSPTRVNSILERAGQNRSVAATKANSRSSRSHSVFILKLNGHNSVTGERSEGTLNLVDLAGSERLSHSGATGDRMKETQHINKSLSCLGDVIGALGQGKEGGHVPYRNSKLTYLLQYSLGGNSKTLMFVMMSPLQAHLGESLTSLKFATKVHNTHIGTAKRQRAV